MSASMPFDESPRLLRRSPESLSARKGRAARSHRRRLRPTGSGRSSYDRAPGRGARAPARYRGRQEPARRLSPRRQHPAGRGKEGWRRSFRRQAHDPASLALPAEKRRWPTAVASAGAAARERVATRGFRGRDARLGRLARARRRLLPRRHGQRSATRRNG